MTQETQAPVKEQVGREEGKPGRPSLLKWLFFILLAIYLLLQYYHAPILTFIGRYLVVEHPLRKSDLIVCLSGKSLERGLAAAEAYKKGFAPQIFFLREKAPDGYELLKKKGINYPGRMELLAIILRGMGVPESAIHISDRPGTSTFDEAGLVKNFVKKRGYKSLIIITSPAHSRRTWLTFRKEFDNKDFRILVRPSHYSKFKPKDWWKKRRFIREVIFEYEKLIYYTLKYFL